MTDKPKKVHFICLGGLYETVVCCDDVTAIMVLTRSAVEDLFDAYRWWHILKPDLAHITFHMVLRRAAMYRISNPRGASRWVIVDQRVLLNTDSKIIKAYLKSEIRRARTKNTAIKPAKHYIDMIASGYCRTSNKYRTVSRIDDPEWEKALAIHKVPWDPESADIGRRSGDTYRREITKDSINGLDPEIFKLFPGSFDGPDYYIPYVGETATAQEVIRGRVL